MTSRLSPWTSNGRGLDRQIGLLLSEDPAAGGAVYRVDLATGRRDAWADIQPQDPAGIMNLDLGTLVTTPDGGDRFYCGGGRGAMVLAVRRPGRGAAAGGAPELPGA